MYLYARSALYFASYALVGPAVACFHLWTGVAMSYFVFLLLVQIWPFWMFTQFEPAMGYAVALAAVGNILAFALLGVLAASVAARSRAALALLFALTCLAEALWFRFSIGGLPRDPVPRLAVAAALALIAVPFLLVARTRGPRAE